MLPVEVVVVVVVRWCCLVLGKGPYKTVKPRTKWQTTTKCTCWCVCKERGFSGVLSRRQKQLDQRKPKCREMCVLPYFCCCCCCCCSCLCIIVSSLLAFGIGAFGVWRLAFGKWLMGTSTSRACAQHAIAQCMRFFLSSFLLSLLFLSNSPP